MKTFKRSSLPESITYNGEIYRLNPSLSSNTMLGKYKLIDIVKKTKALGVKAVLVEVLSNRLRGVLDLRGNLYTPTRFIFTNDME